MCNCGVCICMIYKKVKMAQCLCALKMWSFTEKNPNVFIFKEFFYILAYICVYNFVLVCVKICASWKIDCSVQRKRCFSLPTIAQEDASIQFSSPHLLSQLNWKKWHFKFLSIFTDQYQNSSQGKKPKTLHFYEAVLPGMMKRITSVFHGRDEKR